jgi:hypothetical protein
MIFFISVSFDMDFQCGRDSFLKGKERGRTFA